MNIKKIEEVIGLMEKHNLSEISVEQDGAKIHLKRGPAGMIEKKVEVAGPYPAQHVPDTEKMAEKKEKNTVDIKSPMVGTFYRSPSPDAKPFVDVGSSVKEGDVLCIIEAMKLMNEIKAEVNGKIVDVLVTNAEPVEFGQVLFVVEPSR